jgi:hypothetical protein
VKPDRSNHTDNDAQVISFRPRRAIPSGKRVPAPPPSPSPIEGLAKYEGGQLDDNYRHRMLVNLAGLLVTAALAIAGVWLAVQIADLRKTQDCVFSGRRNCAPIEIAVPKR